ncbi:MAG: hypothetical protein DYG96_10050, partial [Chlorobi bacterium CHB2]|nr:hypothetical protein [Chlorobi bacterium CHB2]
WATIRRIGDVDGSRTVSYAITFDEKVHFLKAPPKDEIPTYGGRIRSLPHPRDFRCDKASSVKGDGEQGTGSGEMDISQQQQPLPNSYHSYHR